MFQSPYEISGSVKEVVETLGSSMVQLASSSNFKVRVEPWSLEVGLGGDVVANCGAVFPWYLIRLFSTGLQERSPERSRHLALGWP